MKERRTVLWFLCVVFGLGILLGGWWVLRGPSEPGGADLGKAERAMQGTTPASGKPEGVAPPESERPTDGGAEEMVLNDEEIFADVTDELEEDAEWATYRGELEARKRSGEKIWGWVKEREYYASLDTSALAEECFDRPTLATFLGDHDDPRVGLIFVSVFHDGFAELFEREDMSDGIIHILDQESAKIADPGSDFETIAGASANLTALATIWTLSPFKEHVIGNEEVFLEAHVRALKAYKACCERYVSGETTHALAFFRDPFVVGGNAMTLLEQIDPTKCEALDRDVEKWARVSWGEQNPEDILNYVTVLVEGLERR